MLNTTLQLDPQFEKLYNSIADTREGKELLKTAKKEWDYFRCLFPI